MTVVADNLDLRRKRIQLGLSLDDVASGLYGDSLIEATRPAISRFERGKRADLPHGKTRTDYERLLVTIERTQRMGGSK